MHIRKPKAAVHKSLVKGCHRVGEQVSRLQWKYTVAMDDNSSTAAKTVWQSVECYSMESRYDMLNAKCFMLLGHALCEMRNALCNL